MKVRKFVKRLKLVTVEVYFKLVRSTRLFALPALRLSRHLLINLLVSKAAGDILGCHISAARNNECVGGYRHRIVW